VLISCEHSYEMSYGVICMTPKDENVLLNSHDHVVPLMKLKTYRRLLRASVLNID